METSPTLTIPEECITRHNNPIIPLTDKGSRSKLTIENSERRDAEVIRVDGCAINDDDVRWDYLVHISASKNEQISESISLFVELKGKDAEHAYEQLERSHTLLKHKCYSRIYWIIATTNAPRFDTKRQNEERNIRNKYGATVRIVGRNGMFPVPPKSSS